MSLPSGYKPVEYIQSSGSQYIDTGFSPNENSRIFVDLDLLTQNTAYIGLFGCRTASNSGFLVFARTGSPAYQSDFGTEQLYSDGTAFGRHTIDKNKQQFYVDGVLKSTHSAASLNVGYNAFLFAINKAGTAMSGYFCSAKLYSCQIYDNGILVRDYVPCVDPAGTAGLYDIVGNKFYGNSGSGAFTAGPVLVVDAPTGFEQAMAVYLKWAAVDCEGYKVYRDGSLLGITANTFFTDLTADMNETYNYALIAYRGQAESSPAELTVYTRSGYFVMKPLIQSAFFP